MAKYSSYVKYINSAISNDSFHLVMIFLEYFLCLFPACFDASIKFHFYSKRYEAFDNSSNMTPISILTYFHYAYTSLVHFIFILLTFGFLIAYHLVNYLFESKCRDTLPGNYLLKCFTAFYDVVFFRYFSLVFIDSCVSFFISAFDSTNLSLFVLPYVFLCLLLWYVISAYRFLNSHFVLMNINNPQLVSETKNYPFDQVSKEYDTLMLLLKLSICIESNVFRSELCAKASDAGGPGLCFYVSFLTLFFNVLIYAIAFFAFIKLIIVKSWIQFHYSSLYANRSKNTLRKFFLTFNLLIMTFIAIGYQPDDSYTKVAGYIISAFIVVSLLFCLYHSLTDTSISRNHLSITYDLILYMVINNAKDGKKQDVKQLQEMLFLHHIANCAIKPCLLCAEYSDSIDANLVVFFNYLDAIQKVDYTKTEGKPSESQYKDIISLFNFHIQKNTFSFFMLYYSMLNKYKDDESSLNNLKLIVNEWLNKDDIYHTNFFSLIFELASLDSQLTVVLDDFVKLANERIESQQHKISFSLAEKLKAFIEHLKRFSSKNEMKDDLTMTDIIVKLTNSVLKYNITILRYIIESLLNQELTGLSALNIDLLEDYLSNHYSHDNLLIMSINFKQVNSEVQLLKVTGELSNGNPQYLTDCFHKKVKSKLLEKFLEKVKAPRKNLLVDYNLSHVFTPLRIKRALHMVKYSYRLSEELKNDSLVVYGYYSKEPKNCVILDFKSKKREISIVDACKEFFKLLKLKSSWMAYFNSGNISFSLSTVFQSTLMLDNAIECSLDYNYLIASTKKLTSRLLKMEDFKESKKNIEDISQTARKYSSLINKTFVIRLEKIEDIIEGQYAIYHLNTQKAIPTSIGGEDKSPLELERFNFFGYTTQNISNSSMTQDRSLVSVNYSKRTKGSEYQMINLNLRKKIEKETKHLSMFSLIMIFLNVLLILICVIFLITQINQTQVLTQANDFLFQFKTLRICVANFAMSITSTLCFTEDPTHSHCFNAYQNFSEHFGDDYGLPSGYSLVEYVMMEVKYKTNYTQEVLSSVQQQFFSSGNQKYIDMFTTNMSYFIFENTVSKADISLILLKIPFHEGLRKYINSMYIICNAYEEATTKPFYFITFENGTYNFDNVISKTLTPIQEQIYSLLINYLNFAVAFNKGEVVLQSSLLDLKGTNTIFNALFMIIIALLNVILFVLCVGNLNTAYSLFKVLIFNVINQLDDKEFAKYFKEKIGTFKQLARLYYHNPNDLINKNKEERSKYLASQSDKKSHCVAIKTSHGIEESIDQLSHLKLHFGGEFYYSIVSIHFIVLVLMFGIYFVTIITLDLTLNDSFGQLFEIYNYVYVQYNHENTLFVNLSIMHIVAILNMTQAELAQLLDKPNSEDGLLNFLMRDNFDKIFALFQYKNENDPVSYPNLTDHLDYNCDTMFNGVTDLYMIKVVAELGKDYSVLPPLVCKVYDALNLPGFGYFQLDLKQRIHEQANLLEGHDYKSLYDFCSQTRLYEAYTLMLIFYRPLCSFFRNSLLLPALNDGFNGYIVFVGLYLCVNIIFEIVIFVVIKWFIIGRLEAIQSNLYLLNNCVN